MSFKSPYGPRGGRALAAILAVAAMGCLVAVAAEDAPPASTVSTPAAPGSSTVSGTSTAAAPEADLGTLERFLNLPPDQLTKLRKTLEYLEKLSPAERNALRMEVAARNQSIGKIRTQIAADLTPPERNVLNRYLQRIPTDDIQSLTKRLQDAATPELRKPIISEMLAAATALGIKPETNPPQTGGRRGGPNGGGRDGSLTGPPPSTASPAATK